MRILPVYCPLLLACLLVAGCDALGIESTTATTARKEADGMAIGSACRHAMRAIEDCYTLNPKAAKAAVYSGWRQMDEYMRENKIDGIAPVIPRKSSPTARPPSAPDGIETSDATAGAADGARGPDKFEADASSAQRAERGGRSKLHNKVAARELTTH
jgi:hypothetical protein